MFFQDSDILKKGINLIKYRSFMIKKLLKLVIFPHEENQMVLSVVSIRPYARIFARNL